MPATLTHQLLEYRKLLKQLELYSTKYFQLSRDSLRCITRMAYCYFKHENDTLRQIQELRKT